VLVPDVNVLVYAYREDSADHERYLAWLEGVAASEAPFGLADAVLGGFLRIVTHPRVFDPPSPIHHALRFVEELRARPNATRIAPGARHWGIFTGLCRDAGVKGNLVGDAYLAALAIESGSEWITTDRDFARFPGLRWRHPLDA
jgi:uncharacterized protein